MRKPPRDGGAQFSVFGFQFSGRRKQEIKAEDDKQTGDSTGRLKTENSKLKTVLCHFAKD
jgi:hypothetical protein